MCPGWAATLPARHSHPIPASLLGQTKAQRDPAQLPKTDPRYSTALSSPLQIPPAPVLQSPARRAVPLGAAPAPLPPLPSHLLQPAARTESARCSRTPRGPQPCPPGCVRAHTRAKKPPVISFPSAVPRSSSRERLRHLPNTRGVKQIQRLGSRRHPHTARVGVRTCPQGHDSFPARLHDSRATGQPSSLQSRRGHGRAGSGWMGERETTCPGTQGRDTRRDGKEPASRGAGHHEPQP